VPPVTTEDVIGGTVSSEYATCKKCHAVEQLQPLTCWLNTILNKGYKYVSSTDRDYVHGHQS
jgi:hypothetical protein